MKRRVLQLGSWQDCCVLLASGAVPPSPCVWTHAWMSTIGKYKPPIGQMILLLCSDWSIIGVQSAMDSSPSTGVEVSRNNIIQLFIFTLKYINSSTMTALIH